MQRIYDYLSKFILRQLLDARGAVSIQQETGIAETQYVDAWFTPDPALAGTPRPPCARVVDRMSSAASLFEPYSVAINRPLLHEAQRKQLTFHHRLLLETRQRDPTAKPPPLPPIWLLMPHQPRFLRTEFEARQMPDWPAGFSSLAPGFQVFPVFLAQLPATRETLPLRLMGSRSQRRAALRELRAIPEDDPDALFLQDLAATLRLLVDRDKNMPEADRSILMSELTLEWNRIKDEEFRRGFEKGEQRGEQKGEQKMQKMLRQMLIEFCEVLAIPLTSERHAHIAGLSTTELSDLWAYIKQHRAWPSP